MRKSKKLVITILLILAIVISMVQPVSAAIGDGITTTVTSNPASGQEVKAGDIITYSITIKNTSDAMYYIPTVMAIIPEGTEYVSMETDDMPTEPVVETIETLTSVTGTGIIIGANAEKTFTLKVKVKEDATGEINFAHRTERDDEGTGAVMFMLFNTVDEEELNEVFDILNSEEFANAETLEEAQVLFGDKAYMGIVTQKQTHKVVAVEEEPEVKPDEDEETQPEVKPEEKPETKPVVKDEKPTELPKTGREVNNVGIAIATLVLIASVAIIYKKQK